MTLLTAAAFLLTLFGFNAQTAPFVAHTVQVAAGKVTAVPTNPEPPGSSRIKKIVIDAGHGGRDSGATGRKYKEKNIVLAIALETGRLIKEAHPDIEVVYTRDTDVFLELHERARIANQSRADLFISIHCNSLPVRRAHQGTETYVLGMHVKDENLEVARRENAVMLLEDNYAEHYQDFDPNSSEGFILSSMNQRAYVDRSIMLASICEQQFERLGRVSHGVKQAGFWVLREIAMPSILIETGFLSSDTEEDYLGSEDGQLSMAAAIARAFDEYRQLVERVNEAAPFNEKAVPLPAKKPQEMLTLPATTSQLQPQSQLKHSAVTTAPPSKTPTPTAEVKPVKRKTEAKQNTVYRVQLAAYKSMVDTQEGHWTQVPKLIVVQEDNWYRYYTGTYASRAEAETAAAEMRHLGFSQAFVVVFVDGRRSIAGR